MKLEWLSVKITNGSRNGQSLSTKLHWPDYMSAQFKAPLHRNVTFARWNDKNSNTESHFKNVWLQIKITKSCWKKLVVYRVQRCQIELDLHQNMSNEYIWFHMLQRLKSPSNLAGFAIENACASCMAADKNISLTTISYRTQYSNSVVLLFKLLTLWNTRQVYWELISLNFYQSMVKWHLKYQEFKIICSILTQAHSNWLKFIENIKMSRTVSVDTDCKQNRQSETNQGQAVYSQNSKAPGMWYLPFPSLSIRFANWFLLPHLLTITSLERLYYILKSHLVMVLNV